MDIRVLIYHVGNRMDQFDDQFGKVVTRSCFTGKNKGPGMPDILALLLDGKIQMDDMNHIEQLALVFMNPLGMDVKNGLGIHVQEQFFTY